MPLYRVSYISRAAECRGSVREQYIGRILGQAIRNNDERGVTGLLVYVDDYFLQCIEGSRGVVSSILSKIMSDDRHQDLNVVHANPVPARIFPRKMSCYDIESEETPLFHRYSVDNGFDPYKLSPESLDSLFNEMIRITRKMTAETQGETGFGLEAASRQSKAA